MSTKTAALSLAMLLLSPFALGYGTINNEKSEISFVSTKNGDVAETHVFKRIGGTVDEVGDAEIWIDLTSVDTKVAIRDERMQKFLFETGLYPKAVITVHIPDHKRYDRLDQLPVGQQVVEKFQGELNLHGVKQKIKGRVKVSRAGMNQIKVASVRPIVISAKEFNFGPGVEKLRELANLKSIGDEVPVSFKLTFENVGPY